MTLNSVSIAGIVNLSIQLRSETVDSDPITIGDVIAQLKDIVGLDTLRGKAAAAADLDKPSSYCWFGANRNV